MLQHISMNTMNVSSAVIYGAYLTLTGLHQLRLLCIHAYELGHHAEHLRNKPQLTASSTPRFPSLLFFDIHHSYQSQ